MNRLSPMSRRRPAPSSAPMMPWACALPLPSPNTVSIAMPAVMYIIIPASATTVSPGSSSTSTNCMSSPSIRKSISWARRPGTVGGAGGGGAPWARCARKRSTSLSGVQASMPVVKTSVDASTLPFLMFATISPSLTGPTWWPPTAIHHSALEPMSSSRPRGGASGAIDPASRLGLQPLRGRVVQRELVRELREVDALGPRDALVRAHDREGERVEVVLQRGVRDPGNDLGQGPRVLELLRDQGLRPHLLRVLEDRAALLEREVAVGPRGGDGQAHEAHHVLGEAVGPAHGRAHGRRS